MAPKPTNDGRVIRITNGEWVPFTGENIKGFGCDSRITTEVFNQMGYSVEYGFFPWVRAMHLAETGEWDGTLEWNDLPVFRDKFYISAKPISEQDWVFFYRKSKPLHWESLSDLEGLVIGTTRGYIYDDDFYQRIIEKKITAVEADSDEANLKKLLAGRIDVFPMGRYVGTVLLQDSFSEEERNQIAFHPKPLGKFEPRLLLSRVNAQNEKVMMEFDRKFEIFKNSFSYEQIIKDCLP